jgi:organic hydroperoxide reductase OsmC/OhrA
MERTHTYRVTAWWVAGQNGLTRSDSAPNAIHFSAPPQFGGMEGRWSPEDLFLSSLASCFTTSFNAITEYSKFEYMDLEVEVEGTVAKTTTGYCFTGVVIRPTLKIGHENDEARGLELLNKTKSLCLVSRALEIPQEFQPHVEINKLVPVG